MFEFIAVVVLANLIMLAVLYVLRHVIAIRAPVLILAVGISIIYCILYPFLVVLLSYPQVLYLYVFLVVAGAGSLYLIENRFFIARELKEGEPAGVYAGEALEAIGVEQTAVSGGMPAPDWNSAGRVFSRPGQYAGTAQEGPLLSVQEERVFVQEEAVGLSSAAGDVREEIALTRYDAERPVDTGAIEYFPEAGLPEYMEPEAADLAAGPESADVPVEETPVMADKIAEGQITADEVAALLKAVDAGEPKGAAEDITFYTEDEIAAAEEGLVPADVPVEDMPVMADKIAEGHITEDEVAALLRAADTGEPKGASEAITFYTEDEIAAAEEGLVPADVPGGVPGRDYFAAGEITATLEGLDEKGPVETTKEDWFTGSDEKESHIGIEEFLPAEEESVLAYEEKTELPDVEWPVQVTGLPEGLEPETSYMAAAIQVEDVPDLADETLAGCITEEEVAAILEGAVAGEPESAGEDISFCGPEEMAAFTEGPEPAELSVTDIPGWDDALADEITATPEGLDMGASVSAVEKTGLAGVDVSVSESLIEELLAVEQESTEQAADAGEEHGDIAELMEELDYVPAEEQSPPGDDLNSLVAMAFDKLASGDGTGAVDSFFRALKLGPPPRLAVLLCTRISSIYSSQGLSRQALAVMEMLEVVWGPMLDDSHREEIATIIIQLRGEV